MNKDKLKDLIQSSSIGIGLHPTIEANKQQTQQRLITPPQPQRTVQSNPMPQQRPITPPQPQRTVQSNPMPQQRPIAPPQPQRTVQSNVVLQQKENNFYVPFNDAPILNLGEQRKEVAQKETQRVAQSVAQASRVAQEAPKIVAQNSPKKVAQITIADKDVEILKEQIFQIDGVEARKKFVKEIGWGILTERRGKKYYLFGAKKIDGKKYKLYIGNATA
jgi:hypothetical protein